VAFIDREEAMRRRNFNGFLATAAAAMLLAGGAPAAAQEFSFKLAHHYPEAHIQAQPLAAFVQEVEANSGGRIAIQVYPAETLVTGREVLEAVEGGVVDMAPMPGNYQVGTIPALQYFTYPFMFTDAQHFRRAVEGGITDLLVPEYEKHNIVLLNYYHKGALHIMHRSKFLNTPAAFEGERLRSLGPTISALMSSMGANPLSVPVGEVNAAIERGVIDGVTTNCAAHLSRGWSDGLKYVTFMDMSQGGEGLGMNADSFNSLPDDLQQVVRDAAAKMADAEWSGMIKADEETCFEKWAAAGVEVHRLTDDERNVFKEKMAPLFEEAVAETPGLKPYLDIAEATK
jgi:TRAP-type C4-dicarboxylate transport system substrate-binding protein